MKMFISHTYFIWSGWRSILASGYLFVEYVFWWWRLARNHWSPTNQYFWMSEKHVILTTYLYFLLHPPVEFQAFFGFNGVVLYSTDSGSIIIEIYC